MKSLNPTSFSLLLLLVLATTAVVAVGAPEGHTRGHNAKHGDRDGKCRGPKCSTTRGQTRAILTLNSFEKGGDGGGPSECDGRYHSDNMPIVALSTGWYNGGSLCHKNITIYTKNGRSTQAMVVDECDVNHKCRKDIVDGSKAVWMALGIPRNNWGWLPVTWST
ncbi:hypothetical protein MLD38_010494 [Melastoma candidum]|uniref:Uncharacterized protein n=1 Tax=Melastoma candidum TaxID=119954 RepID=A0ACB9R008_9MYRT|nr:hypothetical protein MLD38_010494 [Melastoma candidum]